VTSGSSAANLNPELYGWHLRCSESLFDQCHYPAADLPGESFRAASERSTKNHRFQHRRREEIPVQSKGGLKNLRQKFNHAPSEMVFLQLDFPLNSEV
jgi:hypothetical protein